MNNRMAKIASLHARLEMIKAYDPSQPRDAHGRWTGGGWYHGTRGGYFDPQRTDPVYLTDSREQAGYYARGAHLGGTGSGSPHIKEFSIRDAPAYDINPHIDEAFNNDLDAEEGINAGIAEAKAKGMRYVSYDHPNAGSEGEHKVRISLYPHEDLRHTRTLRRGV
jgi:hypothetical protein